MRRGPPQLGRGARISGVGLQAQLILGQRVTVGTAAIPAVAELLVVRGAGLACDRQRDADSGPPAHRGDFRPARAPPPSGSPPPSPDRPGGASVSEAAAPAATWVALSLRASMAR